MRLLFFTCVLIFHCCSHNTNKSNIREEEDAKNSKLIAKDSLVRNLINYTSFENIISRDSSVVMKYSESDLLQILGKPLSSSEFPVCWHDPSQRILLNHFSKDSDTIIKECIWKLDSLYNTTFWFCQEGAVWKPVTFDVYENDAEF
jgi:hypothetical protein